MGSEHVRSGALMVGAALGLGLALVLVPSPSAAIGECESFDGLATAVKAEQCRYMDSVGKISCYREALTKLRPWRCRTPDDHTKHVAAATEVRVAAGFYALDPTINNEPASRIMFLAARVMLIGVEAGDNNTQVCALARETIDYGCNRAYCSLDVDVPISIGGLGTNFGSVRDRHNDVCATKFTRQCDSTIEVPSDCRGINKQRVAMSERRAFHDKVTSENAALALFYEDYVEVEQRWRAGLVDLAFETENLSRKGVGNQQDVLAKYAQNYELVGVEAVLRAELDFYDGSSEVLPSKYKGASKQIAGALEQLPTCAGGCPELSADLERFQAKKQPKVNTNDAVESLVNELVNPMSVEVAERYPAEFNGGAYELRGNLRQIQDQRGR